MAQTIIFRELAEEWWERYMLPGSAKYANESWERLEREVFPELGSKNIKKITAPMVLKVLRRIEGRGTFEVARKVKSHISQTMRYGIACGLILSNPAADLGFALQPKKYKPRAAITEPRQIGQLMLDIENYRPLKRRLSLKLAALTIVRPGELCQGEWAEIDMDTAIWKIPPEKMKMKRPHTVPLPRQALEVLRELQPLTGHTRWLFPSRWDNANHETGRVLTTALRNMDYGPEVMTAHGFRAMAASTLRDKSWPSETIERQLAHVDKNQVRAAYQRSDLLEERHRMMQFWADYLDNQCAKAILEKAKRERERRKKKRN